MIIYNTLTRTNEEFHELSKGRINIFVCGPTVQDHFHIGHARTYIFFDAYVKYLRATGYSVFYLQNITDVDDKIINKSKDMNVKPNDVADLYLKEFYEDMAALNVNAVNFYARATLYIPEIISQIRRIMERGYAYETEDGVYFDVKKFKDYGELSHQSLDQIIAGYRVSINENKKNPEDFVLWKKKKPGEPFWESPWGEGRPGWHIEDTSITETYFGQEYDIHGGGSDLIFPHHEAEIAQMRSISGKRYLARYWIHTGMINVNSEKMSKSLKNYVTIREILKDYRPEELRFALLNANYRTQLEFSKDLLEESKKSLATLRNTYMKLKRIKKESGSFFIDPEKYISSLKEIADEDINFHGLISKLFEFTSDINKNIDNISSESASNLIRVYDWANSFLDIIGKESHINDSIINSLIELRNEYRKNRDFAMSDKIRKLLQDSGIHVEDGETGTVWWNEPD
ncbi:MAG: cysteine--tRNA ligase [Thermoplasmata archaeon]